MDKKQQVVVIHGGTTFNNREAYSRFLDSYVVDLDKLRYQKDWKDSLQEELGPMFDVFQPRMPNATNAQYGEWKKMFDKIIEKIDSGVVLIGHSLGALFLAKYLSENDPAKNIKSLLLVAAPFDDESGESLGSFTIDADMIAGMQKKIDTIFLYYSKDDPVVSLTEADKYTERLPKATLRILESMGHFKQEKFPEIVVDLQNIF